MSVTFIRSESPSANAIHLPSRQEGKEGKKSQTDEKIEKLISKELSTPPESNSIAIPSQPAPLNQSAIEHIQIQPENRHRCTWKRTILLICVMGLSGVIIYSIGRGFGYCTDALTCPENETWHGWW